MFRTLFFGILAAAVASSSSALTRNILDHLDKTRATYVDHLLPPWNSTLDPEGRAPDVERLIYVIGVFRHGARAPSRTFVGDAYPFNDTKFWPDGPKQLTKLGRQQMYALGQTLRSRYNGFLSPDYKTEDVLVKSNPVDRDFMSAACLLAGLYPPEGDQVWNEKIPWQPIPIWEERYDLLKVTTDNEVCPAYHRRMMDAIRDANQFTPQYKKLIDDLNRHGGLNVDRLSDLYLYHDVMSLQAANGYLSEQPDWVKQYYPQPLQHLHAAMTSVFTAATINQTSLIAGPKLEDFFNQLTERSRGEGEAAKRKIYLEAGHETTLNGLLPAFGFDEPFIVDTSAIFLMEMYEESGTGGHHVKLVYYKNSTVSQPQVLKMKNCTTPCPLNQFLRIMEALIPTYWEQECAAEDEGKRYRVKFM